MIIHMIKYIIITSPEVTVVSCLHTLSIMGHMLWDWPLPPFFDDNHIAIADKVSGIFVPTVIILSLLTFAIWMLLGEEVGVALTRAVAVLVISCPSLHMVECRGLCLFHTHRL